MEKEIGKTLKECRISAKMTVKEISEILINKGYKASESTIYSWENENSQPTPGAFLVMCGAYGVKNVLNTFGYNGYNNDGSIKLNIKEIELIENYRILDDFGKKHINYELDRELERTTQAKEAANTIEHLQQHLAICSRFFAYYGRIAAAGTSVEFSDMIAGTKEYPITEMNQNADYVIGVNGDSMEPEYFDGDIVFVQKTDHINIGEIGIFQKGNSIYIKKAGENGLISLNSKYSPLTGDGDRILVLGKVLGKAEEA